MEEQENTDATGTPEEGHAEDAAANTADPDSEPSTTAEEVDSDEDRDQAEGSPGQGTDED